MPYKHYDHSTLTAPAFSTPSSASVAVAESRPDLASSTGSSTITVMSRDTISHDRVKTSQAGCYATEGYLHGETKDPL